MTKLQLETETIKCQVNHYGERLNGTHVNFTLNGKEHDIILRGKYNLKPFQIEEALEELTDYELSESLVVDAEEIREHAYWEADHILLEELS